MERNLTEGSVFKNIIYFSLPYLLSYFIQTLYGMADLFIIGQFEGVASTTAVSIGSQVMHMLTVMIVGLAMGATINIGQAIGARDKKRAATDTGNTATLFMVLSVVLTVVLFLSVNAIVSIMSTPEEALAGTALYLKICFLGIPFITAYNIISSIFRGMGDSKSPMYFIAIAALVTTLSQTVSVIVALTMFMKGKTGITVKKSDFKPRKETMGRLLKIGFPIAMQDGLIQVAFIIITIIANRRGLTDAAAVGIVEKVISFLFLVPSSMLSTVSDLGAQNVGAGKPERAAATLKYAICIAGGFGLIIAIIIQFTAGNVVNLFTNDQAVVYAGAQYLKGYIWDCMFAGIHFSFSGYFCACGRSGYSFIHNITSIALVRVPGVYLTSKIFPETLFPMGLATAGGSFMSVVFCTGLFLLLQRQKRQEKGI